MKLNNAAGTGGVAGGQFSQFRLFSAGGGRHFSAPRRMTTLTSLWLIPALPLLACALAGFAPRSAKRFASGAALAAMLGAFALSVNALAAALALPAGARVSDNFAWLATGAGTGAGVSSAGAGAGGYAAQLGVLLDPLTAFMLVMVTGVSALIFLFSTAYMRDDPRFTKFFCYLSLFAGAMLGIVVSNSLLLTFIAWELVGLASYLLIGFWFEKPSAAAAAKKAFITTRVGDLGFLLGMIWLDGATGTLLFYNNGAGALETAALAHLSAALPCGVLAATAVALLLFAGAVGKSGQFPLHVWLPDAMEGPTPVSALIHAATMVAAGVFLMCRVFPLLALSATAQTVVALTGAVTALLGALIAVAQNDIKRVLAFSTVSQLGYMMLAVGVGAPAAAMFHLLAHAFFKALLFLGAGSVIHAAHHEQDMREMGGLGARMKITFATFSVGMLALAGAPFLFSGFWSKEAVLHGASHWHAHFAGAAAPWLDKLPLAVALVAVVLTAFYMTRLMTNVFFGKPRSHAAKHAHENGWTMTLPLALLAVAAVLFGFLNTPAWPWLANHLNGTAGAAAGGFGAIFETPGLLALSIFLVATGIGAGWAVYFKRFPRVAAADPDPLQSRFPRVWRSLENRLWFDELYAATVIRAHNAAGAAADWLDRRVIGGAVSLVAAAAGALGLVNRDVCEHGINGGVDAAAGGLHGAGDAYSAAQTGEAHGYLRALALGVVALTAVIVWLGIWLLA
ncbi:MAG: NADH-quinone oxidoreductase subunit L [Puniceicoccales bacterium]|nr:NADH-quinone oxidoreductase subunit L [Puniceicoccales bacterium]